MRVVVFHRIKKTANQLAVPADPVSPDTPSQPRPPKKQDGYEDFSYNFGISGSILRMSFRAKLNGAHRISSIAEIPLKPKSVWNIYYLPSVGRMAVTDGLVINPQHSAGEYSDRNYIAKAVVTITEVLIYVRGRIDDVPGVKNIRVSDDQFSTTAISRYSSQAGSILSKDVERRAELVDVDLYRLVAGLQAQIHILTRVLEESDAVTKEGHRKLLAELEAVMPRDVELKNILDRISYLKKISNESS